MKQLHSFASKEFKLLSYLAAGHGPVYRPAATMPEYHWPDGRWCLDVALFLHEKLAQNCEHEPRGGTLGTYSTYLSPLVRYCYKHREKSFLALTDADFSQCVMDLYDKRRLTPAGRVVANNRTTVHAMACLWLDFLSYLGKAYCDDHFVGEHGRIRATKVRANRKFAGTHASGLVWAHHSIGESDPYNTRFPMKDSQLKKLRDATAQLSRDDFQRRRRLVMLELFDGVGLRRIEASLLRVQDVTKAIKEWESAPKKNWSLVPEADDMTRPAFFLSFRMRKQKDGSKERLRNVPISAVTLQFFKEYLKMRRNALKKAGWSAGEANDSFFINLETGRAYQPNFFTQEYSKLAKVAGIMEPCSPHMARARYFTREFVRLILAHQLESVDDFRRALLNSEAFKEQVREISGHVSAKSLDVYINLAFAEVAGLAKTFARVEAQRHLDAIESANERYLAAIGSGQDPAVAGAELSRALSALERPPRGQPI
jgi:integrase